MKIIDMVPQKINEVLRVKSYQDYYFSKFPKSFTFCDRETCTCRTFALGKKFIEQIRKDYNKNPTPITIQENLALKEKGIKNVLGVYAREVISKYACIGEYVGESKVFTSGGFSNMSTYYQMFSKGEQEYALDNADASEIGNYSRLKNFGFPNTFVMPFCDEYQKYVFISLGIEAKEEILWNYGAGAFLELFTSKFVLLGKDNMLTYFKEGFKLRLKDLLKQLSFTQENNNLENRLENMELQARMDYVLHVPSAFIFLHAKGLLNMIELFESDTGIVNLFKKNNDISYKISVMIKEFFKELDVALSKNEIMKNMIYNFVVEEMESMSTVDLLHLLQEMCALIKRGQLNKENFIEKKDHLLSELKGYAWEQDYNNPISWKSLVVCSRKKLF